MTPQPTPRTFCEKAMDRQQRITAAKLALFDIRQEHGLTALEWLAVLGSEIEGFATAYRRDTEPDDPPPLVIRKFWKAPSGRVHSLRSCTGGPGPRRMRAVMLTREEFDALRPPGPSDAERCRCASWPSAPAEDTP